MGLHKIFEEETTRNKWHVRCQCGHPQELDWLIHFVHLENDQWVLNHPSGQPVCIKCGDPFDRLGAGTWVAENPESTTSGYHIPKLFAAPQERTIHEMLDRWIKAQGSPHKLAIFYRFDLGLPYVEATAKIGISDILKAATPKVVYYPTVEQAKGTRFEYPVVIGVDQPGYMAIEQIRDGQRQLIHASKFSRWADLEEAMAVFNAAVVVIDEGGGDWLAGEGAQALRKRHPNRVFTCKYTDLGKEDNKRMYHHEPGGRIIANRQESLDFTAQAYRNGGIALPTFVTQICNGEFVSHLLSSVRVMVDKGEFRWPRWNKGPHGDDYRHADNYALIASLIYKNRGAQAEPHVLTAAEVALFNQAFG